MPLHDVDLITDSLIEEAILTSSLIVFGDNLEGWGRGGQAAICRGQIVCVGIPTKRSPRVFFTDVDYEDYRYVADVHWRRLAEHLRAGLQVFWPKAGIGTGRAQLGQRAPRIWRHVQACEAKLRTL